MMSHRLDHLEQSRAQALKEAERRGGTGDIRAVQRLFAPGPRSIPETRAGRHLALPPDEAGRHDRLLCVRLVPLPHYPRERPVLVRKDRHPADGRLSLSAATACGSIWGRRAPRANPSIAIPARPPRWAAASIPTIRSGVLVGIGNNHLRLDLPAPATRNPTSTRSSLCASLSGMKLNQVTLPAKDLAASIAFYEKLGFVLIVRNDHYARFENPSDLSTLSLELRPDGGDGAHVYFECEDLDARVAELKARGIGFRQAGPKTKAGCGARPGSAIPPATGSVFISPAPTGASRPGGSNRPKRACWRLPRTGRTDNGCPSGRARLRGDTAR